MSEVYHTPAIDCVAIGSDIVAEHGTCTMGMTETSIIVITDESIKMSSPEIIINDNNIIDVLTALEARIRILEMVPPTEGGPEYRRKKRNWRKHYSI